jgi:hypothetical protein
MGYTTDFSGEFLLNRPLEPKHKAYLEAFNGSRRMRRDAKKAAALPDPLREAVGLPIGPEGAYYVGSASDGDFGQREDISVTDHNSPPSGQPGLWCQWIPNEEGTAIEWDGGEKFYDYIEWIKYLIEHFLKPWGYGLDGTVEWSGEDRDDMGEIRIVGNRVSYGHAHRVVGNYTEA